DLLDGPREAGRAGAVAHDAGDLVHILERQVAGVHDVLLLLPVAHGLLQGLDDQGGGGRDDGHLSLPVLHSPGVQSSGPGTRPHRLRRRLPGRRPA
ncbi:hypothetical protein APUTEX25_005369, partial [Auxenochlorella protothecoides]